MGKTSETPRPRNGLKMDCFQPKGKSFMDEKVSVYIDNTFALYDRLVFTRKGRTI